MSYATFYRETHGSPWRCLGVSDAEPITGASAGDWKVVDLNDPATGLVQTITSANVVASSQQQLASAANQIRADAGLPPLDPGRAAALLGVAVSVITDDSLPIPTV